MKIGIATSHLYSMGGGYQAVRWHILACQRLGHTVTVFTRNAPSQGILQNWFDGVALRQYTPHCERGFDVFLNIDHFAQALPEAPLNLAHIFFPMENTPPPPAETRLYSNSAYTARHIRHRWEREATPFYIPIDNHFRGALKEKIILHISRFTRPTIWADKGHEQMIQAFKKISRKMPEWRLVLAGSVDPYMEMYVSNLARLAGGYEIDIMPNLTNQALVDLYARSAIYWHATGVGLPHEPSAQEHMGIAPLEAQASGCVPIVYNSGGMPEVVVHRQTGILFENIADLPEITHELSQNLTAWSQLSQAGYVWTKRWRDLDEFTQRVDDMLNDRPIRSVPPFTMDLNHAPTDVTIVIPTYNSPMLGACLDALEKTAPVTPVFVINNGEPLSNLIVYDNVEILEVGQNLGFAGAHKLASQVVKTSFVFMMNDDVIADKIGWLEQLLFLMNNDTTGVVGPKLYFPDGRVQFAGGLVDFNREDIGYHRSYGTPDDLSLSSAVEVDFITGAALLCRKELYEIPDYLLAGLNMEDVEICFAAKQKGFKVVYQPASSMIHYEGETKRRTPLSQEKTELNRAEFRKRWVK
jgi:GT2 family glycosyltransferase/glycosyltransferase involved in cell wall biosynthesis